MLIIRVMQPLTPEKSESALIAALSLLVPGSRVMDSGVVERTGAVAQVSKGGSWDQRLLLSMHGASSERHNRTKIMSGSNRRGGTDDWTPSDPSRRLFGGTMATEKQIDALEEAIAAERALTDEIISELLAACKTAHMILSMCLPESCSAEDRAKALRQLQAVIWR